MYHFFVDPNAITTNTVTISGSDVNHIKNVLRMKLGEKIIASDGNGASYCCEIASFDGDYIIADIIEGQIANSELPVKITLFQGLPKFDKMEFVIQKAVELGAYRIVPVEMARSIVKLDEKKKKSRLARWQSISESAAKQSGRDIIPQVGEVLKYSKALEEAKQLDVIFVPYECAEGSGKFKKKIEELKPGMSVGVFIGPEGGYETSEIKEAEAVGGNIVSLGKRILRTETAAVTALSVLMFNIEAENN